MVSPAATSDRYPTLASIGQRLDPDGSVAQVIEILNQTNPILQHIPMMPGNQTAGHRTTIRVGLPKGVFTVLYGGVQPTRGDYTQITESTAMLKAYSRFDLDITDFVDDIAAMRMQEDRGHIEGMGQQMAKAIIYSDENRYSEQFTGLTPRFSSKDAANADNIIDATDLFPDGSLNTSDLGSIWIVGWGMDTVCGIYPKNAQAGTGGISVRDWVPQISETAAKNDGLISVATTEFKWHMGLCVRDWRSVVRICNIPRNTLKANPSKTSKNIADLRLYDLYHRAMREYVPPVGGKTCIYTDKNILSALQAQLAYATIDSTMTDEEAGGFMKTTWKGHEWYRVDAMATSESRVT